MLRPDTVADAYSTNTVNSVVFAVAGPVNPEMMPVDGDKVTLPPKIVSGGDMVYTSAPMKVVQTMAGVPGMAVFAT